MNTSSSIRKEVETILSKRIPQALSPRMKVELSRISCGIPQLDTLMSGGLPVGVITELSGGESSGRTTAALACMAAITSTESVCAWIDVGDMFDPETAAANDVDLDRLLWVRCGDPNSSAQQLVKATGHDDVTLQMTSTSEPRPMGGGSPHPQSEGRNMPQAISSMLQEHGDLHDHQSRREKRFIGTPGAPNRSIIPRSEYREEQVNSDRLPPRRGDNLALAPRCAEPQPRRATILPSGKRLPVQSATSSFSKTSVWKSLDQALRSCDLLLQSGGFSAVVFDLGGVPPEFAWRIPLATWFRFRAACERTRVSLVVLTKNPCARSSAELVVRLQAGEIESQNKVMTGVRYCAVAERNRSQEEHARVIPIRKPPQSERAGEWLSAAGWSCAK